MLANIARYFLLVPFKVTVQYRFIQYLQRKNRFSLLMKFFLLRYRIKTAKLNCCLEPETLVGQGVIFPHGFPLVINTRAVIGRDCIIHPNVLIGSTRTKEGFPVIGDNCFLGNGCKIIGNCTIGNWVFIAPGAFVNKDIPSGAVVGYGMNNIISDKGRETIELYLV